MTHTQRLILLIALAVAVPLAGYFYVSRRYLAPKRELQDEIDRRSAWIEEGQSYLDRQPRIRGDLAAFASRTLGQSEEEVEHALRSALNDLGARHRLARLTVDTNMRGAVISPAVAARVSEFKSNKELRDRPDFYRAEATMNGSGSLDQVLATIHDAQALPWLSRLDVVDVSARDNGQRFELRLKLTAPYFRDLTPKEALAAQLPAGAALPESLAALATRNVFHLPPPPVKPEPKPEPVVVAPPADPVAPPPPPPPPYQDWKVTAITTTASGPELWLLNRQNQQRRVLLVSQQILGATFVGLGEGPEMAVVEIEGQRFLVQLGKTLAERIPAKSASVTQSTGAGAPTLATTPQRVAFVDSLYLEQSQAGRGPT
jgi:hypothetical protein